MLQNLTRKVATVSVIALSSLSLLTQAAMAGKDNYRVVNDSSTDIARLYMSESSVGVWVPVTGIGRLRSGYYASIGFSNRSPYVCRYDVLAVFANGYVLEDYNINVCSGDSYRFYNR